MVIGGVQKGASDSALLSAILRLEESIQKQTDRIPRFTKLLRSNRNILQVNVPVDTIILKGPQTPKGFNAIVTDISVNFTTAGGTVKISVLDASGKTVLNDISRDISNTASGQATTVLDEGERVGLVVQTQGAGVVGILVSGKLQKVETL